MNGCPNCSRKIGIFNLKIIHTFDGKRFCSIKCKEEYKNKHLNAKTKKTLPDEAEKQSNKEEIFIKNISLDLDHILKELNEVKLFLNSLNLNERDYSKYSETEIKSILTKPFYAHKIFGWLGATNMLDFSESDLREKIVKEFGSQNVPKKIKEFFGILEVMETLNYILSELERDIKRILMEVYNIDVSKKTSDSMSGLLFGFKKEEDLKKYEKILKEEDSEKLTRIKILLFTIRPNLIRGLEVIQSLEDLITKIIKRYLLKKNINLN
ncbi:MAG: hypothetical protein AABX55_02430 [Nanoarchaeota archaeon]